MFDMEEQILCNPVHKKLFDEFLQPDPKGDIPITLYGIKVVFSEHIPPTRTEKRWVFPQDRFIEYEPSDEEWCRSAGIGHEITVDTGEPLIYRIKPPKWDWLCKPVMSPILMTTF